MRRCPAKGCANGRERHALTCFAHWEVIPLGTKLAAARLIAAGRALRARRIVREVCRLRAL